MRYAMLPFFKMKYLDVSSQIEWCSVCVRIITTCFQNYI